MFKRRKRRFSTRKENLARARQVYFTFKEATRLAMQVKPKLVISVFTLNALWGATAVPGFYLEKLILDNLVEAIGNPDWKSVITTIGFLIFLSLLLQLARTFLGSYNQYLRRTLSRYFDTEMSVKIGKKLSQLDLSTIESPEFRDKFDKIEKESGRRAWGLMMPLSDIPNYLLGLTMATLVLFLIHPIVALIVVLVSIPQVLVDSKFIKKDYKLVTELSPLRRKWDWLSYYLVRNKNYMELKLLGLSEPLAKTLRKTANEVLDRRMELSRQREISRFGAYIPLNIFEFILSLYFVYLVVIQIITIGTYQLYVRSLRSAQSNLSGLVSSFLEIYENYIYVSDLVWFLNLTPDIEDMTKTNKIMGNVDSIKFTDVKFRYRKDNPWVLKGVNFEIKEGEKIALVGENGAGKSTLIKLIARFYDPTRGAVTVSGENLKEIDVLSWRNKLAILFQMFELYPFSAKHAIGYGDINRMGNLDEIKEAAKKTGIHDYIENLPMKYNNPITPEFEKGVQPSIGQWQRFGISRMLFRKQAEILILDEPTSNIDPEAEEKIFTELKKITTDKILIFVTQRFSTVKIADRILVMSKGKVVEQGTHEELMKKKGKYAKLFNLQAEAYLR